jgi:hypothetical protein
MVMRRRPSVRRAVSSDAGMAADGTFMVSPQS